MRKRQIRKEKRKKSIVRGSHILAVFFCCLLLLTGCSKGQKAQNDMKNVEERDYATILMIANGEGGKRYRFYLGTAQEKKVGEKSQIEKVSKWDCDNFEELAENYQSVKGKDLSLAHLKVVLLTREKMDITNFVTKRLFLLLDNNEEIAKTCPVLYLSRPEEFLEFLEEAEEPVGSYLENLIQASDGQNEEVPWIKDYLKAVQEKKELQNFYLEKDTEGWRITDCPLSVVQIGGR